jgi:hypothetical protein
MNRSAKSTKKTGLQIGGCPKDTLHGILIDPYRRQASIITVGNNLDDWYKMMACQCVGVSRIASGHCFKRNKNQHIRSIDLWYDDEFLLKDRPDPAFRIMYPEAQGTLAIHGYGFLCCSSPEGESICLHVHPEDLPKFLFWLKLGFENWSRRVPPLNEEFFEQRMRNIDLEMPGRFTSYITYDAELG